MKPGRDLSEYFDNKTKPERKPKKGSSSYLHSPNLYCPRYQLSNSQNGTSRCQFKEQIDEELDIKSLLRSEFDGLIQQILKILVVLMISD
ncbi:hypothetical protein RclHR1_00590035 [Rhizophagus clarus]|uniref:Uncharacterized protein n=1 Tax=Rhizophagus clarus TaxID=94130 RepID=A0A2Z6SHA0_9GLOM|nr:hypothetical protein RclHR1_00590035 [Rhizophagus clarus]